MHHHHPTSSLLWSKAGPLDTLKCAIREAMGDAMCLASDAIKPKGVAAKFLEKKTKQFKRHGKYSSAWKKIGTGIAMGASSQLVYSALDHRQLFTDGKIGEYVTTVMIDAAYGAVVGGGLASTFIISPILGVSVVTGFMLLPILLEGLSEGFMREQFFKKLGASVVGIAVGGTMLRIGPLVAGSASALAAFLFHTMWEKCCCRDLRITQKSESSPANKKSESTPASKIQINA